MASVTSPVLNRRQFALGCTLGAITVGGLLYWRWHRGHRGRLAISRLLVYPIKSCRGVSLAQVDLSAEGLAHDREYAIVRYSGGKAVAVSQREMPQLSLIVPEMPTLAGITVHKDGMSPLFVPSSSSCMKHCVEAPVWDDDTADGYDMGDEASAWLNEALESDNLRLVRFTGSRSTPDLAKYGEGSTRFSDGFSLLLTSEASLVELGAQSGLSHIAERMRPNIVVRGCAAHEEDLWSKLGWKRGNVIVELRLPKPCARCQIPRVHPFTGKVGPDPLKTLKRYRSGRVLAQAATPHQKHYESNTGEIFFGQNANASVFGGVTASLSCGDTLSLHPL